MKSPAAVAFMQARKSYYHERWRLRLAQVFLIVKKAFHGTVLSALSNYPIVTGPLFRLFTCPSYMLSANSNVAIPSCGFWYAELHRSSCITPIMVEYITTVARTSRCMFFGSYFRRRHRVLVYQVWPSIPCHLYLTTIPALLGP